jgi:hypothetical protein
MGGDAAIITASLLDRTIRPERFVETSEPKSHAFNRSFLHRGAQQTVRIENELSGCTGIKFGVSTRRVL